MPSDRTFDIVLFGATGFTGRLAAEYLAGGGAGTARWAIAGRSLSKLGAIREDLRRFGTALPEMIAADVSDPESLLKMAASARVVLTTVGPYALHGEPVVAACVAAGTDYVDITGEPSYVASIIDRYDAAAREKKIRLVPCCGFDSIPHDLGAQFAVEQLPSDGPITVRAFVRAGGGVSGGTWASALNAFANPRAVAGAIATIVGEPNQPKRSVGALPLSMHREEIVDAWAVPLPTIDPAIVLRSANQLDEYGTKFLYGHFARVKSFAVAVSGIAAIGGVVAGARIPAIREKLLALRPSGEGPTPEQRRRGFFEVDFLAESGSGKHARVRVSGGEPGYHETSKMISESALCLALDRDVLPQRYGVLTTAVAMGPVLRKRLVAAGLKFQIV